MADRERRYRRFIHKRRVALVGPAPTVEGSGLGSHIESHDVVVRINRGHDIPRPLVPDIGLRTDVLYHSCWFSPIFLPRRRELIAAIADAVAWISTAYPRARLDHDHAADIAAFEQDLGDRIPLREMPLERHRALAESLGTRPNAGVAAINDLVLLGASQLFVAGFTFYTGDRAYRAGYSGEGRGTAEESKSRTAFHAIHDQNRQRQFVADLARSNGALSFDPALEALLR